MFKKKGSILTIVLAFLLSFFIIGAGEEVKADRNEPDYEFVFLSTGRNLTIAEYYTDTKTLNLRDSINSEEYNNIESNSLEPEELTQIYNDVNYITHDLARASYTIRNNTPPLRLMPNLKSVEGFIKFRSNTSVGRPIYVRTLLNNSIDPARFLGVNTQTLGFVDNIVEGYPQGDLNSIKGIDNYINNISNYDSGLDMQQTFTNRGIEDFSALNNWAKQFPDNKIHVNNMDFTFAHNKLKSLSNLPPLVIKRSNNNAWFAHNELDNLEGLEKIELESRSRYSMIDLFAHNKLSDINGFSDFLIKTTNNTLDDNIIFTSSVGIFRDNLITDISDLDILSKFIQENPNKLEIHDVNHMFANNDIHDITPLMNLEIEAFRGGNPEYTNGFLAGNNNIERVGISQTLSLAKPNGVNHHGLDLTINNAWERGYTGMWVKEDGSELEPVSPETLLDEIEKPSGEKDPLMEGIWIPEKGVPNYQVSYDPNGGIGSMPLEQVDMTEPFVIPETNFVNFGSVFAGWNTEEDGSGVWYQPGDEVDQLTDTIGETVTLYSQWRGLDTSSTMENGRFIVEVKPGEDVVIPNLPAGTSYTVRELDKDGWVLRESHNNIGIISPLQEHLARFVNEYSPNETSFTIEAEKYLDGDKRGVHNLAGDTQSFIFILRDESGDMIEEVESTSAGDIVFSPISYSEAGTYTYTIEEYVDTRLTDGITFDSEAKTVVVDVIHDDNGDLQAVLNTEESDELTFHNEIITGLISVEKVVQGEGASESSDTFTAQVSLDDGLDIRHLDLTPGEPVVIEDIQPYTPYEIIETNIPAGWELITPAEELSGVVSPGETIDIQITNEYSPEGSFQVSGTKHLENGDLQSGQFTFHLVNEDGLVVAEAFNDAQGNFVFDAIPVSGLGEHHYTVLEVIGTDENIEYDDKIEEITVIATDAGSGRIATQVQTDEDGISFTNRVVDPPVPVEEQGSVSITKTVEPLTDAASEKVFSADIEIIGEDGSELVKDYMFTSTHNLGGYITSGDTVNIRHGETITIEGLPAGATVRVNEHDHEGYTLESSSITEAVVDPQAIQEINLLNIYEPTGEVEFKLTKQLLGGNVDDYQFEFELMKDGDVLETVRNIGEEITFSPIMYNASDIGETYVYHIRELESMNYPEIQYDDTIHEITVEISDDGEGYIIPTVIGGENLAFRNNHYKTIPETGGVGSILLITAGIVGVGAVGAYAVKRRSQDNSEDNQG